MNAPRYGLSLLDVIVSIALAAILSGLIYQALQQTRHVVKKIESTVDINSMLIHFRERIFKDIQGTFIPQKAPKKNQPQQQVNPQSEATAPTMIDQDKSSQEQLHDFMLERINLKAQSDNKDNGSFNFITTSSLAIYDTVTPRAVRVLYEFKKNKDKPLWQLVRSESAELDYKKCTDQLKKDANKGIVVLENIEALEITCYAPKTENKKQQTQPTTALAQPEKSKEEAPTFSEFKTWNSDEQIKDKKPALPELIQIKGSITDANSKAPIEFMFMIPIEVTASNGDDEDNQHNVLNKLSEMFGIPLPKQPQPTLPPSPGATPPQPSRNDNGFRR